MRMSSLFGRTLREISADIDHPSLRLMIRAGLARLSEGAIAFLPIGTRILHRLVTIAREELMHIGAQELHLPLFQPRTSPDCAQSRLLPAASTLHCTDQFGRSLAFAPTDTSAIASLIAGEIASYRQLPAVLYQMHPVYCDNCRSSWLREGAGFTVYALDSSAAELETTSARVHSAFEHMFRRCDIRIVSVEGIPAEGGAAAHTSVAISEHGDTDVMICESCSYAAVLEAARIAIDSTTAASPARNEPDPPEEIATPNCATIADLARFCGVPESATAKAVFFDSPERGLIFAVIRGDRDINTQKLRLVTGVSILTPARPEQIDAIGAVAGYASPVGLPNRASSNALIVADRSVIAGAPLIAGANRHGYHLRNVVYGRDWRADLVADIALAHAGDPCGNCGAPLQRTTGLAVGHTTHARTLLPGTTFLDREGMTRPVAVSSFNIDLQRIILSVIEQHYDLSGMVWPSETAPFDVHLIRLGKQDATRQAADALYDELSAAGITVLYDDRDDTAGVKFNDADLIGIPLRLVLGDRFLSDGLVEIKQRATGVMTKTPRQEILATVRKVRPPLS
ncbi:proline--tRNA ligase [Roseiflexus sp.]|uniref:proline--tRNA ligase n=1 Tax=Roseiflexus sp. TaxID=2562120 RepID=UPI00398A7C0B